MKYEITWNIIVYGCERAKIDFQIYNQNSYGTKTKTKKKLFWLRDEITQVNVDEAKQKSYTRSEIFSLPLSHSV